MDQEYIKRMSLARRVQSQTLAIIQRARNAKIPEPDLRIDQKTFRNLLDDNYYKQKGQNPDKVADVIYNQPEYLFTRNFILIDGGTPSAINLSKAGYAILFRMIACDNNGLFQAGKDLFYKLNTGWVSNSSENRIDIADNLKKQDVLYINQINPKYFIVGEKAYYEAANFFDTILDYRMNNGLPTILSFDKPISSIETYEGADGSCGHFIYRFSQADNPKFSNIMKNDFKILRIRVKEEI